MYSGPGDGVVHVLSRFRCNGRLGAVHSSIMLVSPYKTAAQRAAADPRHPFPLFPVRDWLGWLKAALSSANAPRNSGEAQQHWKRACVDGMFSDLDQFPGAMQLCASILRPGSPPSDDSPGPDLQWRPSYWVGSLWPRSTRKRRGNTGGRRSCGRRSSMPAVLWRAEWPILVELTQH